MKQQGTQGPASGAESVIRFEDVTKRFGEKAVLDKLSLEVVRGETLCIMGPSGTGKSVTLRHIIGLMKPDSGSIFVGGHEMSSISPDDLRDLRRRMGYLFQDGALINWLSVGDNIALPLRETTDLTEAEILDRVNAKLELVKLDGAFDKFPNEISGGMRKRVGLARALITDPEIVLYDEPNSGLDPETSQGVDRLIRELANTLDITSVVVTHLVSCIRVVADRVLLLEAGNTVVDCSPEDFISSSHPRVKRFLGKDPD